MKRKHKSIEYYLKKWYTIALILIAISGFMVKGILLASDVKQVKQDIHWLELKDLNTQILDYQRMYKCYPPKSCLIKIESATERKALQTLLDDKDKLLGELGLPKEEE